MGNLGGHSIDLDCEELARALASRLASVAPEGFSVGADPPGHVFISNEGDWLVESVCSILQQEGDTSYFLDAACNEVLSGIQDFIVESVRGVWPEWAMGDSIGRPALPLPQVTVSESRIDLWFGTETKRALTLEPIELPLL